MGWESNPYCIPRGLRLAGKSKILSSCGWGGYSWGLVSARKSIHIKFLVVGMCLDIKILNFWGLISPGKPNIVNSWTLDGLGNYKS